MGFVGFGSYRISVRSKEHRAALIHALESGCPLIDTSSNYTNGQSEELIGAVLAEHPEWNPILVTKAGYIQGSNLGVLEALHEQNLAKEDLVDLGPDLKHSIHPEFLKNQIDLSLERLQRKSIDVFLLHNPEYYFKMKGATQKEYYERIKKAFAYLEEEVASGRIKSYGISSNHFVLPLNNPEVTDLSLVLQVAKAINAKHFKVIQFPFNLIEIGALEKYGEYGDMSLIEMAQMNGLTTMANRPLNAFTNDQLVRLATYEFMTKDLDEDRAEKNFQSCMKQLKDKWNEGTTDDEQTDVSDFDEITLLKQFKELWKTLASGDAVDQVYHGHFFPFIARVWGGSGLNAKEAVPFYQMLEDSHLYARKNMTARALTFKGQAEKAGLIPEHSDRPFSVEVIDTYLSYGIDFVLLGMRRAEYIDQVKHFFKE
jgi:aryl-alcohol dehydrogenase-like predicted oxidoreductase